MEILFDISLRLITLWSFDISLWSINTKVLFILLFETWYQSGNNYNNTRSTIDGKVTSEMSDNTVAVRSRKPHNTFASVMEHQICCMKWQSTLMCLVHTWKTRLKTMCRVAWLTQYIYIGPSHEIFISQSNCFSHIALLKTGDCSTCVRHQ